MVTDQQKKRLKAASIVSCNLQEQYWAKEKSLVSPKNVLNMRSHIFLEWDDNQKRAVAKREQIGITWRDVAPFIDHVSHCHPSLADVFAIPQDIFELENLNGVLSYEVWETHLSERERNLLTQFLPRGTNAPKVVQALLKGENLHFGNPFLKWSASLCSGNLHPDAVLRQEHIFKASKIAYYFELQKYHNDIVKNLQKWKERWASCKDPENEIVQNMWRSPRKHVESSLSSHTNESGHFNWGENLAATAESCPWVADEKVCSSNKQNTSTMNRGELQKRKGFMKGRCGNTLVASERPKVVPSSRKEENPQKRCVRSGDSAKYMSYVKISRKQHQIVKSMKQSADGIQTKSLNHVLGHIKSFQVQPYEAFEEEEQKKLHEHWLHLANRGIPAAFADWRDRQLQRQQLTKSLELEMAEKKKPLMAKDEKEANSGTGLLEQRDNGETDHEPIMDIRSYEDDEESVPSSTRSQPLQQIPLLNGHHELDLMDMDLEEDNRVMLKPEVTTPNPPEYLGNINSTDTIERGFPVPSAKDGWVAVGMPDSYYHRTSVSHGYTSSSEMSLRQPQPTEERPACLVDLESDILEDVGEDLLHGPSNDVVSALHVDKGGSFFSSYTNRDSNELLHPFFKGQEILPSYPHEHQQPGLRFSTTSNGSLETGQLPGHFQEQQQQLLEQRHMREKELYMHHMNQKNMYSNGGRYSISSQELFSPVDVQDWAVDPVHISTPLQPPLNSGGLLGQNWFPGEHRARGVWFGMDGTGTPGQCLGNGSNADESLFSVLSQWNGLQSYSSYNSMSATEQYVPARNFVGGEIPGNNGIFSQTTHQLNYLSGREAPAASALRTNNMPWMNSQHQNSGLHDSIGKPFLRSWNQ